VEAVDLVKKLPHHSSTDQGLIQAILKHGLARFFSLLDAQIRTYGSSVWTSRWQLTSGNWQRSSCAASIVDPRPFLSFPWLSMNYAVLQTLASNNKCNGH
jgi:hypothetical protein